MKKAIQLRGTNATGKTTCVRDFISKNHFQVVNLTVSGRDIGCHWDEERKIFIIGRYDIRACGGLDGSVRSRDELLNAIARCVRLYNPDTIIFEGVIYGITYQLATDINKLCHKLGYEYVGVEMRPPLDTAMNRLEQRNGGKPVNYRSIQDKYFSCQRTTEKLKSEGFKMFIEDTSKYDEDNMHQIIERLL